MVKMKFTRPDLCWEMLPNRFSQVDPSQSKSDSLSINFVHGHVSLEVEPYSGGHVFLPRKMNVFLCEMP